MPDEDKNFGGSLVSDFRKRWRHMKTFYWIFTQTKLSSIYRRKYLRLEETSCVACISGETQTRKISLLFGRDRLYGEILASVWHMEGNFEVLKRCYIQVYPAIFAMLWKRCRIFNICKIAEYP